MSIERLLALSMLAVAGSMPAGYAGPCTEEIDRMQVHVDEAVAAAGATARESTAATRHQQPTPDLIAVVEEGLSQGTRAEQVLGGMAWARAADDVGIKNDCDRALEEVQGAIGK
jgi:hypothetical protein